MRRRALVASILSSTAVLVVGWQIGANSQPIGTAAGSTTSETSRTSVTPPAGASAGASSDSGTASSGSTASRDSASTAGTSGSFTGSSASTRFGDVQVAITVENGTITDVTALRLTDADGRSVSISNRAAPILRQEVLDAQSASVQTVSGATYTSRAYLTSLQSAIDQAGL